MHKVGLSTAICLCHKDNLWTFQLRYPRYIHSEFMTHRVFSRNASSSRAKPVEKIIEDIKNDPVVPNHVFYNKSGMVGDIPVEGQDRAEFTDHWIMACEGAIECATLMMELGVHKQHINRILEPYSYIDVIVTSTDWDNFFKLRLAPDAQPEIQDLAKAIKEEMDDVGNQIIGVYKLCGRYVSLPYITHQEFIDISVKGFVSFEQTLKELMQTSSARCARVSYSNHDGTNPDISKDKKLFERLEKGGHMSPMEHPCVQLEFPDHKCFNLKGWRSFRHYRTRPEINL